MEDKMLRLQVVNQKAKGRSAGPPADKKRSVRSSDKRNLKKSDTSDFRELLDELRALKPYLMIAGVCVLSLTTLVLLFVGYRSVTTSSLFYLKDIDVGGTSRASTDEVKAIVRRSVAKSGVWGSDIQNIRRELEEIPWVRSAIVSRVLPDGLRIRVTERVPQALIRLSKDRVMLADEEASILGPARKEDRPAPFVLRGWDEAIADVAREDNRQRVEVYRTLTNEWRLLGIASRVSEINLGDLSDVRVLVAFDDDELEIRLGDKDFGSRLKYAINQAELESGSQMWPCYKYIDVSQGVDKGSRVIFGPRCSDEELERLATAWNSEYVNEPSRSENNYVQPIENNKEAIRKEVNTDSKPSNRSKTNKFNEAEKAVIESKKQKPNSKKTDKSKNLKQKETKSRKA